MKFRTSEVLQSHFNDSDQRLMLGEQANELITTGDFDSGDDGGEAFLAGIERGFELLDDLKVVQGIRGNEDAGIYQLSYEGYEPSDYCEQNGYALFIGTEKGLANLFMSNPKPN